MLCRTAVFSSLQYFHIFQAEIFNFAEGKWDSLPPLKQGRHGTQAITINKQIIIGAGSGNRGGGPELNSFEVFAKDNSLNFSTDAILAGELKASQDNLDFSKQEIKSLRISHKGGNQAIIITEINISDNFSIVNNKSLPFILAPRSEFELKIEGDQNPGKLSIKRTSKKEAIIVNLNNKD